MSTTTRWVTTIAAAIVIAAPIVGAQARKPRVVIVATGGTIAGAAESTTAAGYKSGAVAVDTLIAAVSPPLTAGTVAQVTVVSASGPSGALSRARVSDFLDVPPSHLFHEPIVTLVANGIAAGCGSGQFCADAALTRGQAAPLLLRARDGVCQIPPPCAGVFR